MCSNFSNVDFNECNTSLHNCNPRTSICHNTIGSYTCHCLSGFALNVNAASERKCTGKFFASYVFVKDF